jgi:hypothetical protein
MVAMQGKRVICMSYVDDFTRCPQCGFRADTSFCTQNSETDVSCKFCGYTRHKGSTETADWAEVIEFGAGALAISDHTCHTVTYTFSKAEDFEKMVASLEQDVKPGCWARATHFTGKAVEVVKEIAVENFTVPEWLDIEQNANYAA